MSNRYPRRAKRTQALRGLLEALYILVGMAAWLLVLGCIVRAVMVG